MVVKSRFASLDGHYFHKFFTVLCKTVPLDSLSSLLMGIKMQNKAAKIIMMVNAVHIPQKGRKKDSPSCT